MSFKILYLNIIFVVVLLQSCCGQKHKKFFRKDYTYLEGPKSFYKMHSLPRTWEQAKMVCALDGASLFYPTDEKEAHDVIEYWNKTQPHAGIFIGISSRITKGVFETIEGRPIIEVYHKWAQWEPNDVGGVEDCVVMGKNSLFNDNNCDKRFPFICKKTFKSLEWNEKCQMPDLSYIYNEALHKCYKFHTTPMNWTDAFAVCSGEQSYLAIINSESEATDLIKLSMETPKKNVLNSYVAGAVHIGFHNIFGEGWRTVKGMTLEDSGYVCWGNRQPDGGEKERCGSMFYEGTLNDISCHEQCFFICEHDLPDSLDQRFGIPL